MEIHMPIMTKATTAAVVAVASAVMLISRVGLAQHTHDHGAAAKQSTASATESDSGVAAGADHAMNGSMMAGLHMTMTPDRPANRADSARAADLVRELRSSIAKYKDVRVAVEDGYVQFAPGMKSQKVLHFTNRGSAVRAAFSFDPARPTSLLYKPVQGGQPILIGAMYTAPKRASLEDLDKRVPLSVAKWHKHTNFCVPPRRHKERWSEVKNGVPVFGPLSPIATEEECDKVDGRFYPEVFGWMVHANVFESDDPAVIWGDDHGANMHTP
jgi:hypothetical protein